MEFALPPGALLALLVQTVPARPRFSNSSSDRKSRTLAISRFVDTVKLAYVDQMRPLDPDKTIWQEISAEKYLIMLGNREVNSRGYGTI